MALDTVKITGTFNLPDASWAQYTRAVFVISGYDTDTEVITPEQVIVDLGAGGELDVDLWPNTAGLRGTVYRVYVDFYTDNSYSNLIKRVDFRRIQVSGSADISDLLNVPVSVPGAWYTLLDLTEEDVQAAIDAADRAEEAAALADSEGNATIALNAATSADADAGRAEAARDTAETYAGVDHRAATWAALSSVDGVAGDVGYVPDEDTGTHTDPVTSETVPNSGVYEWADDGLGSAQAERVGDTGLSSKADRADVDEIVSVYGQSETGSPLTVLNEFDQTIMRLNLDGTLDKIEDQPTPTPGEDGFAVAEIQGDLLGICSYGQSLGWGSNGLPLITTSQRFDSLRFVNGVRIAGVDPYASLVDLVERDNDPLGETPVSGAAEATIELLISEDGRTVSNKGFRFLGWAAAQGGVGIAGLRKGGTPYLKIEEALPAAVARAGEIGRVFDLPCMEFYHGEGDTSANTDAPTYIAGVNGLRGEIDADAAAATGFEYPRPMIGYQCCSQTFYSKTARTIALAQLQMHRSGNGFYITTPNYIFATADGVHLTAEGYKWLGAFSGLVKKRLLWDRVGWDCLQPLEWSRQGSHVIARFATETQLSLDTSLVTNPGSFGFDALDAGGSALAISSVEVVGLDRVKFTFGSNFPAGGTIRAGFNGTSGADSGPTTGARVCLRDSLGDDVVFDPDGINKRMDRYCVFFSEVIA